MITSFVMYIICFSIFSIGQGYGLYIIAFVFYALGDAFRTGTHKAMIYDYLRINGWSKWKVDYYGHTRSWSQKGSAFSALIAGAVIFFTGNYRWVFIISLIPALIDLLLIASYPKELDGVTGNFRWKALKVSFKQTYKDFIATFKQPAVLRAIANTSIYSGYYKALKDFLQPVLLALATTLPFLTAQSEEKRTAIIVGITYTLIYLITSRASRKSAQFSALFSSTGSALNSTLITGIVTGIISGTLLYLGYPLGSVVFYILIYIIENTRKPIGMGYTTDYVKHKILATALSAESQLQTIWATIIIFFTGFLADKFTLGISLIIISGILLLFYPLVKATSHNNT